MSHSIQRNLADQEGTKSSKAMRKFGWLAAALVMIALTAGAIINDSSLNDGYGVLRREGPKVCL